MPKSAIRAGSFVAGIVVAALVAAAVVVSVVLVTDPFETRTVDRTPPPVLQALSDLAEYHAATGEYQVLVDLEKDVERIPAVLAGERTFFIGQGSVDAYVSFAGLDEDAITVNGKDVTITLPAAVIDDPALDLEASHVAARDRGLFNRAADALGNGGDDDLQELYLLAEQKLAEAAQAGELRERAEDNTREMLTKLLQAVGYENVTVVFEAPDPT